MKGISSPKNDEITNRQLCHFFLAEIGFGMAVATALGVNVENVMPKEHNTVSEMV